MPVLSLDELLQSAQDSDTPISAVLRRTLALAQERTLPELTAWLTLELNGYPRGGPFPEYRRVSGRIEALDPLSGRFMPAARAESGEFVQFSQPVIQSVPVLEHLLTNPDGTLEGELPTETQRTLRPYAPSPAVVRIGHAELIGVLNAVRNELVMCLLALRPAVDEPAMTYRYEAALSFAGEQRVYVEQVARILTERGVSVFYDRDQEVELWGSDLLALLGNVYGRDARYVVMFVSEEYARKAWPTHERQHALARILEGNTGAVLPARFDDTTVPGLPAATGYIDLRTRTPEELADLLFRKLRARS